MTTPSNSAVQNLLPVQAYFNLDGSFNTFIGQGKPFYATANPIQSGLTITNSTLDSSPIGSITPSTGVFTNISTTTGQISTQPSGATDIVNLLALQSYAAGISWKQPVACATLANITLSGLQTIDGYTTLAGDRVIVKNQSTQANNGIYIAASGAWTRSSDANTWNELVSAIAFVEYGSQAGSAWFCTVTPGGTLGTTAVTWAQFTTSATYTAGTGLTLAGFQFSITPQGTAGTYGFASSVPVFTTNASGQVTSVTNTSIAIANTQVSGLGTMSTQNANNVSITGGSITGTPISGSTVGGTTITASTQFSGAGTGLTGTATSLSIGGNAATATTAITATTATTTTNLAGGAAGSLPYQSGSGATTFLAAGTNGQYLTLSSGLPTWVSLPTNVSSFSAGTTGFTPSSPSTGAITLAGTLNIANGGTGNTTGQAASVANSATFNNSGTGAASGTTFNGSAAQTISYNTLGASPLAGSTSLTTLGTVTTGTWNAGIIGLAYGGTNANLTAVAGGVVYSGASAMGITAAGTTGQFLTSNGTSAPSWSTVSTAITITDDTSSASNYYPLFARVTTGTTNTEYTSSTKYTYNPSTGVLSATSFTGAGTGLTGTATSLSIGGNAATATSATSATIATNLAGGANGSVPYQTGSGATTFLAAGTNGYILTLAGGVPTWAASSSGITITDNTSSSSTYYPALTTATSGTITGETTSSTKLSFVPSTGVLSANGFNGALNGSLGATTASSAAVTTLTIGGTSLGAGNASIMKNRIINGAMVIDQRNAGASYTPTTSAGYCLDRWKAVISQNSKLTTQQSITAPTGFSNSLLVTSSSAYSVASGDYFTITQFVEGFNFSDMMWGTANAKTVTLSFWVQSSLTGSFGGSFCNSAENRSYPFSYTISAANTWEQKTITVAGDTSGTWIGSTNGKGLELNFSLGCGSTNSGTANTWGSTFYGQPTGSVSVVGTNGATFYITGVQLEVGSSATGYEYRQYGQEFALCQRYYEIGGDPNCIQFSGYVISGATYYANIPYIVTKRATPTVVNTNANNGGFSSTASTAYTGGTTNLRNGRTSNANNNGGNFGDSWTASAEL